MHISRLKHRFQMNRINTKITERKEGNKKLVNKFDRILKYGVGATSTENKHTKDLVHMQYA